jgi:hypothetical protein
MCHSDVNSCSLCVNFHELSILLICVVFNVAATPVLLRRNVTCSEDVGSRVLSILDIALVAIVSLKIESEVLSIAVLLMEEGIIVLFIAGHIPESCELIHIGHEHERLVIGLESVTSCFEKILALRLCS